MRSFARAAVLAAGFAAMSAAGPVHADALAPSLQSFGAAQMASAYELSASGMAGFALQPEVAAAINNSGARLADAVYGTPVLMSSYASSTVLTPNLALDAGQNLDVAQRFSGSGDLASPFLSPVAAPFLALANGGRYAGVTFADADLRARIGASVNSERLDRFRFDPAAPSGNLGQLYDASQTHSLLAGITWDVTHFLGLEATGIASERSGVPLGLGNAAHIAPKSATQALGVSAQLAIGQGWVTTASFSEGLTQLDTARVDLSAVGTSLHEQSFSIGIAKHGVFGDDTLGLSYSRPAPSMAGFANLATASGGLPPLVIAQAPSLTPGRSATESDIQLGYVTNFLGGAVALQTNAAYQQNFQGQEGATSVSLLSRAKIKF